MIKRKLLALGLSLFMGLSLVVTPVSAAPKNAETIEDLEEDSVAVASDTYEGVLDGLLEEDEQVLLASSYDRKNDAILLAAALDFRTTIDVKGMGLYKDTYVAEWKRFCYEHPELVGMSNGIACTYNSTTKELNTLKITYKVSAETGKKQRQALEDKVSEILNEIDFTNLTDVEKALAVHDYIASHTTYAVEPYRKDTLGNYPNVYDAYGCLVDNYCVCQGYAMAYMLLLNRIGITTGYATSNAANHAWNVVKIGGAWYHVDVTHDDPVSTYVGGSSVTANDTLGKVNHKYFMISSSKLLTLDPDRKDMVVNAAGYGTTGSTYDSGYFWSEYETTLYPYKGYWYSLKASTVAKTYDIIRYKYSTRQATKIKSEQMPWKTSTGATYPGQYGKVYGYGPYLFYSTAKEVRCLNLDTLEDVLVYAPSFLSTGTNLYGFGYYKGKLAYMAISSPSAKSTDYINYFVCQNHMFSGYKCAACGRTGSTYVGERKVDVSYHTHIQTFGDNQVTKRNGAMAGTSGMSKRLENLWVKVSGDSSLGIQYSTHCQSYGWLPWSSNGELNGTSGEAKRLEAIRIQLTGANKGEYNVYYRVHAQSYGWLGWAKNGEPSGTAGYGKRLEGIQIVVLPKTASAPGIDYMDVQASKMVNNSSAYIAKAGTTITVPGRADMANVNYRTHVQSFGWQAWKVNGQMSGTSGMAKRLEGINIKLTNRDYSGGITYRTHVQTYGWQDWKSNGQMSGTSGQAKRLEAIEIKLTGELEKHYDVYYRVHAQSFGWLGWAKNGSSSGTEGLAKRLEGIQIVLVPKGSAAPAINYGGITSVKTQAYIKK